MKTFDAATKKEGTSKTKNTLAIDTRVRRRGRRAVEGGGSEETQRESNANVLKSIFVFLPFKRWKALHQIVGKILQRREERKTTAYTVEKARKEWKALSLGLSRTMSLVLQPPCTDGACRKTDWLLLMLVLRTPATTRPRTHGGDLVGSHTLVVAW